MLSYLFRYIKLIKYLVYISVLTYSYSFSFSVDLNIVSKKTS